jgi:hypothetical protein
MHPWKTPGIVGEREAIAFDLEAFPKGEELDIDWVLMSSMQGRSIRNRTSY